MRCSVLALWLTSGFEGFTLREAFELGSEYPREGQNVLLLQLSSFSSFFGRAQMASQFSR